MIFILNFEPSAHAASAMILKLYFFATSCKSERLGNNPKVNTGVIAKTLVYFFKTLFILLKGKFS